MTARTVRCARFPERGHPPRNSGLTCSDHRG
ncbi:hypothetical protein SFR_0200 [Streptomyces sp. FR-008]|nr:hypothetical protein SFR_0200 [Streptomyces sp. FR-008]